MRYLGAFALPGNDGSGVQQGDLIYGGQAMSVTPSGTLLLGGLTWFATLCELSIPGIGGTASVLQRCADVTEGRLDQVDPGNQIEYGGSLVYNGRLILSAYSFYDADGSQKLSHFASGTNLAAPGDVIGPVQVGPAAGYVSGYMGLVPQEWQAALGGPALTGNCCLSIIMRTSAGPSVSAFNPDDIGRVSPVPTTPLLGYPLATPIVPNIMAPNPTYVRGDVMAGVAFPSGTRSVLFIGRHGTGTPCYGEASECGGDPGWPYKGDHAFPYQHQVWAYDANDLVAVKNGQRLPWDVKPYATWALPEMNNRGTANITSAFYDHATMRIYITEYYGNNPRVHVYQVGAANAATTASAQPTR